MDMLRWLSLVALLATTLFSVSACGAPPREIAITLREFSFAPAQVEAKSGEKLRLVLTNAGKLTHTFVSQEMKISRDVEAGKSESVEAIAPGQSGDYTFTCGVPGHEAAGMRGAFVVK